MKVERRQEMRERDNEQRSERMLQRVRCSQCRMPLVQLYQGDLTYTLHSGGRETTFRPVAAYSYRTLTDPTLLTYCPRCSAVLSPAAVTAVNPVTIVTEEKKGMP